MKSIILVFMVLSTSIQLLAMQAFPKDIYEYRHLDPNKMINQDALIRAVRFFKKYKPYVENQKYMTLIDMNKHSSKKRMHIVNMKTGQVSNFLTAHGKNSDINNDGFAEKFSNTNGSLQTSLGFYFTGDMYYGQHGLSLYLHGLQSTNNNAYSRAIVIHGAQYINPVRVGRSFGCPAIESKYVKTLLPAMSGGSLILIFKN